MNGWKCPTALAIKDDQGKVIAVENFFNLIPFDNNLAVAGDFAIEHQGVDRYLVSSSGGDVYVDLNDEAAVVPPYPVHIDYVPGGPVEDGDRGARWRFRIFHRRTLHRSRAVLQRRLPVDRFDPVSRPSPVRARYFAQPGIRGVFDPPARRPLLDVSVDGNAAPGRSDHHRRNLSHGDGKTLLQPRLDAGRGARTL